MARVSTEELLGRLEKGKPVPAILLYGEEPYLRDACRMLLIERYVPEASRTWAVSRYSAGRGETQAAVDQAQTMAMLSPQQVVFLEDARSYRKARGEKPGRGGGASLDGVSGESGAVYGVGGGSDGTGSANEVGEAAGGEDAGGGMRAWRESGRPVGGRDGAGEVAGERRGRGV